MRLGYQGGPKVDFRVGFIGSKSGITALQQVIIMELLSGVTEFHHCGLTCSDSTVHNLVKEKWPEVTIVLHPFPKLHEAIDSVKMFIVAPGVYTHKAEEVPLLAIAYCKKTSRKLVIIYPDGTIHIS